MKTLILMRHAKSSWKETGLSDHQRPLNKRGKRDAPRMASVLEESDYIPDHIICSTAVRAQRTAELFIQNCSYEGEVVTLDSLYHGDIDDFIEAMQSLHNNFSTVMIIGHNPGLEYLLEYLTDEGYRLPTAAIAIIELAIDSWNSMDAYTEGELLEIWRPKEI
jgi:phosphohistidine phosphatase